MGQNRLSQIVTVERIVTTLQRRWINDYLSPFLVCDNSWFKNRAENTSIRILTIATKSEMSKFSTSMSNMLYKSIVVYLVNLKGAFVLMEW